MSTQNNYLRYPILLHRRRSEPAKGRFVKPRSWQQKAKKPVAKAKRRFEAV